MSVMAPAPIQAAPRPKPSESPIHVRRLPPARLVPIPESDERYLQLDPPDGPMPVTSPTKPWDRVAIACSEEQVAFWLRDDYLPDAPLPKELELHPQVVGKILVHAVEILLGHRPCSQLRAWLSPQVFGALSRRAGLAVRINGRAPACSAPRVRHIHVCRPRKRVAEAAVVLHDGQRMRAAAVRLEFFRDRWQVVALEIA